MQSPKFFWNACRVTLGLALLTMGLALILSLPANANDPPEATSIELAASADGMVYRDTTVKLFANGTDDSDDESELDPYFEYMPPDSAEPLWDYDATEAVYALDISADGEYLVSGSMDNDVRFFHKDNATPLWSFIADEKIYGVTISENGDYLAAGSASHLSCGELVSSPRVPASACPIYLPLR